MRDPRLAFPLRFNARCNGKTQKTTVELARDHYHGETTRHRRIIVPRIIRQRRPPFTLARVSMTGVNYQQVDTEYSVGYGMGLHVRGILPLKPLSILGKLS